MHALFVQIRVSHEKHLVSWLELILNHQRVLIEIVFSVFFILKVKDGVPNDWQRSHGYVVKLIDYFFVKRLSRES